MNFGFKRSLQRLSWRRSDRRQRLGRSGERAAARFLAGKGYRVIARNYRNYAGEIDLIVSLGAVLAFVEVKTRVLHVGDPVPDRMVAFDQWRRIEAAARIFLSLPAAAHRVYRFDLVRVLRRKRWHTDIEHVEDAHLPRFL